MALLNTLLPTRRLRTLYEKVYYSGCKAGAKEREDASQTMRFNKRILTIVGIAAAALLVIVI